MNEAHKQGYHEQISGGEVGEKEKQSCSGAVERQNWRCSGGGEEQAEWSGLHWHLRPYNIWALMQPRSALISVTHLTTKGHVDVLESCCIRDHTCLRDLNCYLEQCPSLSFN